MKKEPGYFREWCIETPIEKCAQNTINTNKFLHCVVYAAWKKGADKPKTVETFGKNSKNRPPHGTFFPCVWSKNIEKLIFSK